MNLLSTFMETLCLAEGIDLFIGNGLLMFVGPAKKKNHNPDKVYGAEKWTFLIDVAYSFGVSMNRLPRQVKAALLALFAATLVARVYVFKSRKFHKKS